MTKPTAVDAAALLRWVELELPEPPWSEREAFLGFVYLDPKAGLTAKGGRVGDESQVERPSLTVRLPIGVPGRVLDDEERAKRGLPEAPSWLSFFGPQPPVNGPWRTDPGLRGRFHPQYPDDLQVLVHDGEPRRTGKRTEVCWVRVDAGEGTGGLYEGTLLNQPHALATVKAGDRIRFLSGAGGKHPLYVTAEYLAERDSWEIQPCPNCGFHEALDPPTVMARTRFPDALGDAVPVMFTAHCALCGPPHAQVLQRRGQ
jgi:hypothetical protein